MSPVQSHTISADQLDAFVSREDFDSHGDHLDHTGAFMAEHGFEKMAFDYSLHHRESVVPVARPGVRDDVARAAYATLVDASGNDRVTVRLDLPGDFVFARPSMFGWIVVLPVTGTMITAPNISVAFDMAQNHQ